MTASLRLEMPDGAWVSVPLVTHEFDPWDGPPPPSSFGSKPIVKHRGEGVFAEIAYAGLLREKGWDAVWVSTYGGLRCFDRQPAADRSNTTTLPAEVEAVVREIAAGNGSPTKPSVSGMFDVVAWRGSVVRFHEMKRAGADRIRDTQRRWVWAALRSGVAVDDLRVVEWSLSR